MKFFRHASIAFVVMGSTVLSAADGQIDLRINPTSGVTISSPGSYVLVDNVTMTANVDAIQVNASDVTIDLNGHSITGAAGNTSRGIDTGSVSNICVTNGTISGFGRNGINISSRGIVRYVTIQNNNANGNNSAVLLGTNSQIEYCLIEGNSPATGAAGGLGVAPNSRVIGNIIENNVSTDSTSVGINAGFSCVIEGNTVRTNDTMGAGTATGIVANLRCLIRGNNITDNDANGTGSATGINASAGCLIDGNVVSDQSVGGAGATGTATGILADSCTITDNECIGNFASAITSGSAFGINAGNQSRVKGNRCAQGAASGTGICAGILADSQSHIEGNTLIANTGGAKSWGIRITGTGNYSADNYANGNGTAGEIFVVSTSNRSERNRFDQSIGVDTVNGVAPASAPGGALADVNY